MSSIMQDRRCFLWNATGAVAAAGMGGPLMAAPPREKSPPVPQPSNPRPPAEPGSYSGPFSGQTEVWLMNELNRPDQRVDRFNLKETFDLGWSLCSPKIEQRVRAYLTKKIRDHRGGRTVERWAAGRRLYDLSIELAPVTNSSLQIGVRPSARRMTLIYRVTGNQLRCKADVNDLPDPTVKVGFDLQLVTELRTDGPPEACLAVQSARALVRNPKVEIDGNVVFEAVKTISEFFSGRRFEQEVAQKINGSSNDLTSDVELAMQSINRRLRKQTVEAGYQSVSPWFDRPSASLFLQLRKKLVSPPTVRPIRVRKTTQ